MDHFEKVCYYNDGNTGGSDFSDDNFEDCYFTDGHEEYGYLNDGLGVYGTGCISRSIHYESLAIKDQLHPR